MVEPSDENLVERIARGDENAFVELIKRYEHPITTLIRYEVNNPDDADDILQETLMDAWVGLKRLAHPGNVRAWLLQVARNRCRDFFRSKQRRDVPVESSELEQRIDRLGFAMNRYGSIAAGVIETLDEAPEAERRIAKLFYLEGLTIREIAERHRCPQGTIKRRLFQARDHLREALDVPPPERIMDMSTHKVGSKSQPFPKLVPEIEIVPLQTEPFVIDCREMRYWSIIPEVGQRALTVDYDALGNIKRVWDLCAARQACIHKVDGVEVELQEWWHEDGWKPVDTYYYGRVLEDKVQWLAGMEKVKGATKLRTFLDEGFVWAYPDNKRQLSSEDLLEIQPDGSLKTTRPPEDFTEAGAGYFNVRIGRRSFACLRIVGLEGAIADEDTAVTESYVADTGRVILTRHYCNPSTALRFGEPTNDSLTVTVDDRTFSHFRDTLTDTGCEIDLS